MKKLMLFVVLGTFTIAARAIPAHPKPIKVQQPDGSFVTITLHGDEWNNFNTTEDGYSVVKDGRGYYVYAELADGKLQPTSRVAHDLAQRSATEKAFLVNTKKMQVPEMEKSQAEAKMDMQVQQRRAMASRRATAYDKFRGLVVLVQFKDKKFSRTDYPQIAEGMLNQENYTGYDNEKYTGSVRDYFSDNSGGKFKPQFDVAGPVTVNYNQNDGRNKRREIACAALDAIDPEIDFSQYDGDGDGIVDLVYFIIAGNGSNYSGNNSGLWWPHRWTIRRNDELVEKDNVLLYDYASSVELYGWTSTPSSVIIDGIGTICHEFSHVLGLPDFYDADYEKSGGQSNDPDEWSVMAGGSYFNNARTPVGYSLYERYSVGFIDEPEKITAKGTYTLEPLQTSQMGYRIDSSVDDEFFLFENRQKSASKWDANLPGEGMLVHRVDKTDPTIWANNDVNCNPDHNYYQVVWAKGVEKKVSTYDTFPGAGKVTELTNNTTPANLKSWSGEETLWGLFNIRQVTGTSGQKNIVFNVASLAGTIKPTKVASSNITPTSATVTWKGATDDYHIRHRIAGVDPVIFEDGFEDGLSKWTIYTQGDKRGNNKGWYTIDPSNDLSFKAHGGNSVVSAWSSTRSGFISLFRDSYDADNWLVTPQVTMGKTLKFWVRTNRSYPDQYEVLLSTTGKAIADFKTTLKAMASAPSNNNWNEVVIDLSKYTGQVGYIAIHHECYDKNYLLIDDFGIYIDGVQGGEWQTATVSDTSTELKGLTPATDYEVQVQSFTEEESSPWSESVTFTTNELSKGDINGEGNVDAQDASLILQYVAKKTDTIQNADVNGDGVVDAQDASLILQYVAKKITW